MARYLLAALIVVSVVALLSEVGDAEQHGNSPLKCAAKLTGDKVPPYSDWPEVRSISQAQLNYLAEGTVKDNSGKGARLLGIEVGTRVTGLFLGSSHHSIILISQPTPFHVLVHEYIHYLDWYYKRVFKPVEAEVRAYRFEQRWQECLK